MELKQAQSLMAKLFTDIKFRERVRDDPEIVGREFELQAADLRWLQEFSEDEGRRFARSLIRKRLGVVINYLPLTERLLGKRFGELYSKFAAEHETSGVNRHLHDAIDFASWLKDHRLGETVPNWLSVVIRYEQCWLEAQAARGWFFRMRVFRHDISNLKNTPHGDALEYIGRPNLVLWWRWSLKGEPREQAYFPRFWPS